MGEIFSSSTFLLENSKTKQNRDRNYRADYENQHKMFARLVWIIDSGVGQITSY